MHGQERVQTKAADQRGGILVNDNKDPYAALGPSVAASDARFPGRIYLPKSIYEAVPAAYVSIGSLLVLGAVYIGIASTPMVGYATLGLWCIFNGVRVHGIRRKARSA